MTALFSESIEPTENARPDHSTVFFFGAGASMAAGVPDTKGFVDAFRKSLEGHPEDLADLDGLLKVLSQAGQQADVEALLEALDFLDPDTRSKIPALAVAKPNYQFSKTSAAALRKRLHDLIVRKAVVHPSGIGYLDPLADYFQSESPLDVFSVNYDTCVELFCHTRRIKFTDGFGVEWRPSEFERHDIQLRLIKLHGSVLWYETSAGGCIRIPTLPESGEHMLFTHETAQPLMLYPARKWGYAEPLLHNLELFRTRLSQPDTRNIIVVGYSFRDEHLRRIFFDVLRANLEARIILISPDAWTIYQHQLEFLDDARSIPSPARNRVVCLPYRFEAIFPLLREKVSLLPTLSRVHGRATLDWGGTLENALRSEDIASAVVAAPRDNFTYANSEGTRRAVKAYIMIRLLEVTQARELLSLFPKVEERFREIIGNIRLEVPNANAIPHFKLDSRTVNRGDGTRESTQPLEEHDFKFTLEWTLKEFEPLLIAADVAEAPVVKRLNALRDRLGAMTGTTLSGYEQLTIPQFTSEADRSRFRAQVKRAVEIIVASNGSSKAVDDCEKLCEVERILLAELTSLPSVRTARETVPTKAD